MQCCSLDVVCVGDEAPSSGHTVVRTSSRFILEHGRPNNVHQHRDGPEEKGLPVKQRRGPLWGTYQPPIIVMKRTGVDMRFPKQTVEKV